MSRLFPLLAAIAAISIVGVGLSMTIPLIAVRMEAAGYSASAQDALRQGVVVLQKPYDLENLRRNVREAIESAKARRRQTEPAK